MSVLARAEKLGHEESRTLHCFVPLLLSNKKEKDHKKNTIPTSLKGDSVL